jgi:hypothetical protein
MFKHLVVGGSCVLECVDQDLDLAVDRRRARGQARRNVTCWRSAEEIIAESVVRPGEQFRIDQ